MLAAWVLVGFAWAVLAPLFVRRWHERAAWFFALYPLGALVLAMAEAGGAPREEILFSWLPRFGLVWGTYSDGLALTFSALIGSIGFFVVLYAGEYLRGHPHLGRFYTYLIGFTASMLGLVVAQNFFMLFVCWELTTVFSYLLIGFENEDEKARKAAWQALLTTSIGGLALLVGFLLLHDLSGVWSFAALLAASPSVLSEPAGTVVLALLLLAAFTKSAQFPFHYWLPSAMAAPTPVSAYLHSATMVKAGVYLLARMEPVFGDAQLWQLSLTVAGAITMLSGGLLALAQSDGKLLLAYSTVSALGTLVFLLGLGTPEAASAAMLFLFAHALYKGGLFLSIGIIDHEFGSRDVDRLSGLSRALPLVALVVVLLAGSFAGLPPSFGFVAKEHLLESALHSAFGPGSLWFALLVIAAACQVAAALILLRPFAVRAPLAREGEGHGSVPAAMLAGPAVLAASSLFAVLFSGRLVATLLAPAARSIDAAAEVKIALWHGITPAALGSAAALLGGAAVFWARQRWRAQWESWRSLEQFGPAATYERALQALQSLARWQTELLQSGILRRYQVAMLLAVVGGVGGLFWARSWVPPRPAIGSVHVFELVVAAAALLGAAVALRAQSRLTAVAGLGVTGYSVALVFLLFGAPDLAMTQFAVETLTVVLFVLVLYRLPPFLSRSSPRTRLRDAALALGFGTLVTLSLLSLAEQRFGSRLAPYFLEHSLPDGKGRNVVNVILVDFRSLDTLGEITVLGIAALGVAALMAAARRAP